MKKGILSVLFVLYSVFLLSAQETYDPQAFYNPKIERSKGLHLGVEFGSNFVFGSLKDKWSVKQDINVYNDQNYYNWGTVYTSVDKYYVGLKAEYPFFNHKLGIISGLRVTFLGASLETDNRKNYFDLRYETSETGMRFAKVRSITERNLYLGIPLEVRYTPLQFDVIGFYVKAGSEVAVRLHAKTEMDFVNKAMESKQEEIFDKIGGVSTNSMLATFYTAIGFKLMWPYVTFNFEAMLPSLFLTSNNSCLVGVDNYSGIQLSLVFPLNMKQIKQ